ncbi:Lpg1974 family pore-forming outer membrane protein [Planctomicrobium sp. SH661]|uniref:Lpg1974 family pore-forming outer membrane protein n=1 Tax=Planctomicrobium sp. SH661 TaxID=3448124 RepID=UPI003F5B49AA
MSLVAIAGPVLPDIPDDPDLFTSFDTEIAQSGWATIGDSCVPESCPEEGLTFFADLLYWKLTEGAADNWAQVITPMGTGTTAGTATLIEAPFNWKAGIRVGMGYQRSQDLLDFSLAYTNFQTNAASQAAGEVYSAFLANFYASNTDGSGFGPHYRGASMDWDFAFHTIDFEAGHNFEIDESLQLRPFLGLKAAIINQSMHSTWRDPIDTTSQTYLFDSATENLKQDFWGIGPSVGVVATIPWVQGPHKSLRFFASPSGSIMYGNWTFQDRYQNDGPTSTTVPTQSTISINTSPIRGAATMFRAVLGVEWNQYFSRATTTVRLSYEGQIWLNQMQFYSYNMGRLNNLMSLQGGVLELCLNF